MPFPNINWWAITQHAQKIIWDGAEHFEKMTYRNKYFITGANGGIQLSIPLLQGREQRTIMQNVCIDNRQRWQIQHWRTLVSVYNRTPYFEHYKYALESLFLQQYDLLIDFNMASIEWLLKQLKTEISFDVTDTYKREYPGATDIRSKCKPGIEKYPLYGIEPYYQVFSDKNGFLPNLSILDLLFAEGPLAGEWIKKNEALINGWKMPS